MQSDVKMAGFIANLLDNRFSILGFRFGIDIFLDMIPVIGDIGVLILSFYIVMVAMRYKVPNTVLGEMIFNIVVSFILGLIPAIGEATYLFMKPNIKNYELLKEHLSKNKYIEGEIIK